MIQVKPSLAVALAVATTATTAVAADSSGAASVGQVVVDYGGFSATRAQIDFTGGIRARSDQYTLTARSLAITLPKGKPTAAVPFEKAVALGSGEEQVHVRLADVEGGQSYDILSDKAVLTPDPSRSRGAQVVMTGHVVARISTPAFAEPSVTTVDRLTVLLGPAPEYPMLKAENGHTTIVPAQ